MGSKIPFYEAFHIIDKFITPWIKLYTKTGITLYTIIKKGSPPYRRNWNKTIYETRIKLYTIFKTGSPFIKEGSLSRLDIDFINR